MMISSREPKGLTGLFNTTDRLRSGSASLAAALFVFALLGPICSGNSFAGGEADQQLVDEVDRLNDLAERYERAGGTFSGRDNAELVLTRLALASGDLGQPASGNPGVGRVVAVMVEEEPTGRKWAFWNNTTNRFQLWRGKSPVEDVEYISRFTRSVNGSPLNEVTKSVAEEQGEVPRDPSTAVHAGTAAGGATFAAAWGGGSESSNSGPAVPELEAPTFDPPGGDHPVVSYSPMKVRLLNSNPGDSAEVYYSIGGSIWNRYSGDPITVKPGEEILAFCATGDKSRWADSDPVVARYTVAPIVVDVKIVTPASQMPASALSISRERPELFPQVRITNAADLPGGARSSELVEVLWTIDGSDPATSSTAFPLDFPRGLGQAETLPLSAAYFAVVGQEKVRIRVVVKSKARLLRIESEGAATDLKVVAGE